MPAANSCIGRVDQKLVTPPSRTTGPCPADSQLLEPGPRAVVVDVHPLVEQPVSDRELPQPVCIAVEPRAHDPDAELKTLERLAAPKQRLQHEVTELELPTDEGAKLAARESSAPSPRRERSPPPRWPGR